MTKRQEIDVARPIVDYLRDAGWAVYQEVDLGVGMPRFDIVATRGPVLRVVETKTSFSSAVVEQAIKASMYANHVHVGIPSLHCAGRFAMQRLCRYEGIGILEVSRSSIVEVLGASFNRKALTQYTRRVLVEDQKEWGEAGNSEHNYYTPWRATCRNWASYVAKHSGCTIADMLRDCEHHYRKDSTARTAMTKWIGLGKVPGIRSENVGHKIRLYEAKQ
jgi:hypothetical protein